MNEKLKHMNKFERIDLLKAFNINTEDSILITNKSLINFPARKSSVRTFSDAANADVPHYPVVAAVDVFNVIDDCLKNNLSCIVSECIDPKDCCYAGVILMLSDKIIIEIAFGSVTVRDITHKFKVDKRFILDKIGFDTGYGELNQLLRTLLSIGFIDVSYEFSFYNKPIGYKKERMIVWEVSAI